MHRGVTAGVSRPGDADQSPLALAETYTRAMLANVLQEVLDLPQSLRGSLPRLRPRPENIRVYSRSLILDSMPSVKLDLRVGRR